MAKETQGALIAGQIILGELMKWLLCNGDCVMQVEDSDINACYR